VPRINELCDLEITDPSAMRALADPVRLAVLERLQRDGPATSGALAAQVGAPPDAIDGHLHELAAFGIVVQGDEAWRAVARGIRFDPAADEESQAAYRALSNDVFLRAHELPKRWLADDEPHLEPEWRGVSGLSNARVSMTIEEAQALDARMEALLEPYVNRDPAPEGTRKVRWLRYVLPERSS
jgi:DNA-binding transcriptional ArsR family regulator